MITFGGFSSVVRFFTPNSDFGLFLFWFTLEMMCTFWWTRNSSYICWNRIDPKCSLFAWCHMMLLRWTNWRPILWSKWVFVEYKSDPLLNVDGAFFGRLILILILWFVWTVFIGRKGLYVFASRVVLQNCSRDGKCLYYLTKWRIFYWYVLIELLCHLFEELVL